MIDFIREKIYRKLILVTSISLITVFACLPVFARNHVDKMDIDVTIHDNGSASITQRWVGTFDEGTEVYLPIEDKSLSVRNLKVWKGSREYLEADGWNVDWSFDQKKWRSGINRTAKGVELCFGISEYGESIYTFSYDIDPLVKSYIESDGFNFQFVNSGMGTFPSDVNLRIQVEGGKNLSTGNARIWGFGYEGMTSCSEAGYAIAFSTSPLRGSNYMNVTLEIFKGLITPNVEINDTFENAVLNRALVGSSFEETLANESRQSFTTTGNVILMRYFPGILLIPVSPENSWSASGRGQKRKSSRRTAGSSAAAAAVRSFGEAFAWRKGCPGTKIFNHRFQAVQSWLEFVLNLKKQAV